MLRRRWTMRLRTASSVSLIAAGLALGGSIGLASKALAGPAGSEAAVAVCQAMSKQASEYGSGVGLIRAEQSTAVGVADWQEHRYEKLKNGAAVSGIVSRLRDKAASAPVTVCLFSGQFVTPVGPPNPDGSAKPPHDVLRLLVLADGSIVLDSAGYSGGSMDPETPRDWELAEQP